MNKIEIKEKEEDNEEEEKNEEEELDEDNKSNDEEEENDDNKKEKNKNKKNSKLNKFLQSKLKPSSEIKIDLKSSENNNILMRTMDEIKKDKKINTYNEKLVDKFLEEIKKKLEDNYDNIIENLKIPLEIDEEENNRYSK